jgi:hypothetical protein
MIFNSIKELFSAVEAKEELPYRKHGKSNIDKSKCEHEFRDWVTIKSRYGGHRKTVIAGVEKRVWTIHESSSRTCKHCGKHEHKSEFKYEYTPVLDASTLPW